MRALLFLGFFLSAAVSASAAVELQATASALSAAPGSELGFTFTLTNHGTGDVRNVVLTNPTAPITQFISFVETSGPKSSIVTPLYGGYGTAIARMDTLHAGESAIFQLLVRIDPAIEFSVLTNHPVVEYDVVQYNPSDPARGSDNRLLYVLVGPDADLKVASRAPDFRQTRFPITVDVGNGGPQSVNRVEVVLTIESDLAKVKYLSITPSQGTCSEPVIYSIIASPTPPPVWRVECSLGTLASGGTATISAIIDTKPVKTFLIHAVSVFAYNDHDRTNNESQLLLWNYTKGRTRSVRK